MARQRKYHRLRLNASRLAEISPLARFTQQFQQKCLRMSFKHLWFMHLYKNGVLEEELERELEWARDRNLSLFKLRDLDRPKASPQEKQAARQAMEHIVHHYGAERVSSAKDRLQR